MPKGFLVPGFKYTSFQTSILIGGSTTFATHATVFYYSVFDTTFSTDLSYNTNTSFNFNTSDLTGHSTANTEAFTFEPEFHYTEYSTDVITSTTFPTLVATSGVTNLLTGITTSYISNFDTTVDDSFETFFDTWNYTRW